MKWVLRFVGIAIFAYVILSFDMAKIIGMISGVNPVFLLISVLLIFPQLLLKSCRWRYLLHLQNIEYGIKDSFLAYLSGIYIGMITPGRVGEIIKCLYIKKDKAVSFGLSLSSVFVDRVFDIVTFVIFGAFWVLLFQPIFSSYMFLALLAALFIAITALLKRKMAVRVFRMIHTSLIPQKYKRLVKKEFNDFYRGIQKMMSWKVSVALAVSLAAQLVYVLEGYTILISLGIGISYIHLLLIMSIMSLVVLIPVTVLGIGTRDIVLILLFSAVGLGPGAAISFSFMLLFVNYLIQGAIGFVAWSKKPVELSLK